MRIVCLCEFTSELDVNKHLLNTFDREEVLSDPNEFNPI